MDLFKRETPQEKRLRKLREKDLDAIYEKAKFEAQKEAAKRDGKLAGSKGRNKRTIMDRLSAAGKEASNQINILEDIIGDPPKGLGGNITNDPAPKQATVKSKQQKVQQPIVIVIDNDNKEKKKKTNNPFRETWGM